MNKEIFEANKEKFQSPSNERAVIACVIQNPDLFIDLTSKVDDTDFLTSNHRAFFSVLFNLFAQGVEKFDLISIVNEATDLELIKTIGGAEYVDALLQSYINEANFPIYVGKLIDRSTKYKLYKATLKIQENVLENVSAATSESDSAESLISDAEASIIQVALDSKKADDALDIRLGMQERLEELATAPTDVVGLSSGFPLMDKLINGLRPNTLTIFAARPKTGKSTLLMNMAAHMSYSLRMPVLYIDTEMNRNEVQTRIISHLSQVPEKKIVTGQFATNGRDQELIHKACKILENGKEYLHRFMPGFREELIGSIVRKYKARSNIAAFFFDYIKLPDGNSLGGNVAEHQQLGFLTTMLKDLAGTLNIPVITAAQVNREGADKSRLTEGMIGGSDRLLHYCTSLLALSRKTKEEMDKEGGFENCGTHTLQVLASRHSGSFYEGINLQGHLPRCTFKEAVLQPPFLQQSEKDYNG
jgi:replicative DNA helicase